MGHSDEEELLETPLSNLGRDSRVGGEPSAGAFEELYAKA